jgi:hypothetical protein
MSERVRELVERQTRLQLRCAVQRREIAREVNAVEARLYTVDRVAAVTRRLALHPAAVIAGVVALLLIGRATGFGKIGRGLLLASAGRRLWRIARLVQWTVGPRGRAASSGTGTNP